MDTSPKEDAKPTKPAADMDSLEKAVFGAP